MFRVLSSVLGGFITQLPDESATIALSTLTKFPLMSLSCKALISDLLKVPIEAKIIAFSKTGFYIRLSKIEPFHHQECRKSFVFLR